MNLLDTPDTRVAKDVKVRSLKVLFAEHLPYATEQFESERFPQWSLVVAEKTESIIEVLAALKLLRVGRVDGYALARSLTRSKKLKEGFLALCSSEFSFVETGKNFQELEKARKQARTTAPKRTKRLLQVKRWGFWQTC